MTKLDSQGACSGPGKGMWPQKPPLASFSPPQLSTGIGPGVPPPVCDWSSLIAAKEKPTSDPRTQV